MVERARDLANNQVSEARQYLGGVVDSLTCFTRAGAMLRHGGGDFSVTFLELPTIDPTCRVWVQKEAKKLDDFVSAHPVGVLDYRAMSTLSRSYLLSGPGGAETVEGMFMRVAVGLCAPDLEFTLQTYLSLANRVLSMPTPTLFNAATSRPQLASCYLLCQKEDSIEGIYDTVKKCAQIQKYAGGIGLATHCIRGRGAVISGTNGTSNGITAMLPVFDATAQYVDQGGGKRPGSVAVYLAPWHADIRAFLQARNPNQGGVAPNLFYGLWISDLFMQRVCQKKPWTLFSPDVAPGLSECTGEEFETLYTFYEKAGVGSGSLRADELMVEILRSHQETGMPYMLYKDSCNTKSNQRNHGVLRCANLCTEIVQFTAPDEVAVCNLASICLPKFVRPDGEFDFEGLRAAAAATTVLLDQVIDRNYYPVAEAAKSNLMHRPIGIGVQGLSDTFVRMRLPYGSPGALALDRDIFETIYYGFCQSSVILAAEKGSYPTFDASPAAEGHLQFDLWDVEPSNRWPWDALKKDIKTFGMRNCHGVALMPTASSAKIMGNSPSIEPPEALLRAENTFSGTYLMIDQLLVETLKEEGCCEDVIDDILADGNGSVQSSKHVSEATKKLFRTAYEIGPKALLQHHLVRAPFVDQHQSHNVFPPDSWTVQNQLNYHVTAWMRGAKGSMYYYKTRAAGQAHGPHCASCSS